MIPSRAQLRSTGKIRAGIADRKTQRQWRENNPPLVEERNSTWRESRRPDNVDSIRASFVGESRGCDRQKIVVNDFKKIARSKAIRGREDIRLAPANELLPRLESYGSVVIQRAQTPDFRQRPLQFTIAPGQLEFEIDLVMRVDA